MKNALDFESYPKPDGVLSDRVGTVGFATKILQYMKSNITYLFVDNKWFGVEYSADDAKTIWIAANNPEKFTIVLYYDSSNVVIWTQVRTREKSDPVWSI